MTYAQKMRDERRIGYAEGVEDGIEINKKDLVVALKDLLEPAVLAERFKMPLERVLEILSQS